jgi:hypothetical protein
LSETRANSLGIRLFDALASLRLAVVTMVSLALTCLTATIYESKHGTAAAQREIYHTAWFSLILAMLGINIFCVMMKRYPWKAHQAGFLMAHVGILLLLTGSLISLHFGLDSNMALFEGETTDRVALLEKALQVALPGGQGTFPADFDSDPPRQGRERRFPIPGTDAALVATDFLPHARLEESFDEGSEGGRAIQILLDNPFAKQEVWLLADDPARSQMSLGAASFEVRTTPAPAPVGNENRLTFVILPQGAISYTLATKAGAVTSGPVTIGTPIETPWMGMKVQVRRALSHAVARREFVAEPPPDKDERRMPALKVRIESPAGASAPVWLAWSEAVNLAFPGGLARVAYRSPELAVPFKVTLTKFNSDKYPGSNMPATYESWVRVEDPEQGSSEHHISMNNPLHYRGYVFFQASFVEGEPMMSIFSVARAPGLPLVYVGVILITGGVAWMFYLKPYLARRQAARALKAHREKRSQAEPDAVPGGARTGEPASSGA